MDNPKNQIAQKLKEANNVLVTVSANPSVDQLAAAIGLTLLLNKLDKHASAVFSGNVPSTIEFLHPEDTLEKNTDSLRDFIIALDKSKADKLRYKVEDRMVKIFITPYRTSITDQDLVFSQGDFNVDVVVGIGVKVREDLDQAIVTHGGILHDAVVVSINTAEVGSIGSINWVDVQASSLCEMIVAEAELLKAGLIDAQIATALLTGIVAETERFSNAKTTSNTMNASAKLMAAGANQQLVATQLDVTEPKPVPEQSVSPEESAPETVPTEKQSVAEGAPAEAEEAIISEDGTLQVEHPEDNQEELPEPQTPEDESTDPVEEEQQASNQTDISSEEDTSRKFMTEPPVMVEEVGQMKDIEPVIPEENADQVETNSQPATTQAKDETEDASVAATIQESDPKLPDVADDQPVEEPANTDLQEQSVSEPASVDTEPAVETAADESSSAPQFIETPLQTLDAIEHSVGSKHVMAEEAPAETEEPAQVAATEATDLDQAREAVQVAMDQAAEAPAEIVQAAAPVVLPESEEPQDLPDIQIDPDTGNIAPPPTIISPTVPVDQPADSVPPNGVVSPAFAIPVNPVNQYPAAPPPGPPPMMPTANDISSGFPSTPNPFSLPPTQ